ncbi:hypothetical protein I4U23_004762 [Adineta vaga]|nr:hypothetical protein I4U23_004762 [Adineta vaga]
MIDREVNSSNYDNPIIDMKDKLLHLKKSNEKEFHTICIVGLEKAGKSTFINALLGYELLDVPGFDSPIKEHRDAGLEAIKLADAFFFLTNGQQPSLTGPQIDLLQEIQQNHFEAMQRAFGIITKLDLCQTASIYQEHYDKTFAKLIEKCFKSDRIYATCLRMEILNENSE